MDDDPFDNEVRCPYCRKLVDKNEHDFEYCSDPNGGDGPDD